MKYSFISIFLLVLSYSFTSYANVEVMLNPIEFDSEDPTERMNQIYSICDEKIISIDSTVQFVLAGCTAPVLVSMDAMRSSADPFNPDIVAFDELDVKGPLYEIKFKNAGMYIVFCDPSFKTVATCITIKEELVELTPLETVPTMGEWGLICCGLSLIILGIVGIQQESIQYGL